MNYAYDDEYMKFDESRKRYVLTEKALLVNGTNMRARLSYNKTLDAGAVINRTLMRVSEQIYNYLHSFNNDNSTQDYLIANISSLRSIIYNAMICQAEYFLLKGDLTRALERDIRAIAIDEGAKAELNTVVPELNVPITYAGGFGNYGFS
jgi:hypothetical protein